MTSIFGHLSGGRGIRAGLLACFILLSGVEGAKSDAIRGAAGLTIDIDKATGGYTLISRSPAWTFAGSLGVPLSRLKTVDGKDQAGPYRALVFSWKGVVPMAGRIRVYTERPVVVFSLTYGDSAGGPGISFPRFTTVPGGLSPFRYSDHEFSQPPIFLYSSKGEEPGRYGGPLLLFDDSANALIISPAANFMVAAQRANGSMIEEMLNPAVSGVPRGFQHSVVLAIEGGINRAWDTWGRALTDLYGKHRPANDADAGLKYLSYWTDNGATYYYQYDKRRGYEGTLLALKRHDDSLRIPLGAIQLDSWWYEKSFTDWKGNTPADPQSKNPDLPAGRWNRYGGLLEYVPDRALFPRGLRAFQEEVKLPLITHNRWMDPASPYHRSYRISGLGAVDGRFWEKIAGDLQSWGVKTYEQDWLNYIYEGSPQFASTLWAGAAFMDGMAAAMAAHGLTMQYCMALPRHFLQGGAKYPHLTTIRVSGDRFEPMKWREFLFTSRMASALGIWPFSDVFMSGETPNMLLAVLSAGMVGIGDAIGREDRENIMRAVRADGVIVKPDVPIVPVDRTYIAEARQAGGEGMGTISRLASTYTDQGTRDRPLRTVYLFAYKDPSADSGSAAGMAVPLRMLGIEGGAFVYDFLTGTGVLAVDSLRRGQGAVVRMLEGPEAFAYRVIAPVGPAGMALAGDADKFAMCGRKRIAELSQTAAGITAAVLFARGEDSVALVGYAPRKPTASAEGGTVSSLRYDDRSGIFRTVVRVGGTARSEKEGADVVRKVKVNLARK